MYQWVFVYLQEDDSLDGLDAEICNVFHCTDQSSDQQKTLQIRLRLNLCVWCLISSSVTVISHLLLTTSTTHPTVTHLYPVGSESTSLQAKTSTLLSDNTSYLHFLLLFILEAALLSFELIFNRLAAHTHFLAQSQAQSVCV